MATRSSKMSRFLGGATLAAALVGFGSQADAGLVFDIRLADGSKTAQATTVGQVLNFDIFAIVTGADGNAAADGIQSAIGYLRSTGPLMGDLTHTVAEPFNTGSFNNGLVADRDGDGDLDVGGAGTAANVAGQIQYRAAGMVPSTGAPIKLGSGTFTVKSLDGTASLGLFRGTPSGAFQHPLFMIDGQSLNSVTGPQHISVGAPLTITGIVDPGGVVGALEATPLAGVPTYSLAVSKGSGNGQYITVNPLNAGDELPEGGAANGAVNISGITPDTESPIFVLLGLSGDTNPFASLAANVGSADPNFVALQAHYPWLDALLRFDNPGAARVFNFDDLGGSTVTEIAAVPEPTMLGLASIAGLGLLVRRRRNA